MFRKILAILLSPIYLVLLFAGFIFYLLFINDKDNDSGSNFIRQR